MPGFSKFCRLFPWLWLAAFSAGGCGELGYYWQAGWGQLEILNARVPIEEVLASAGTEPAVERKLRLVQRVQIFGTERLALPAEGHYRSYADLGRDEVSWLVVAAEPLAMREYRFCYPIVGCLGYRGYFKRDDAESQAAELRIEGYDVIVRPVRAYSTLGWFEDPVLNTFLRGDELQLIGTILHEQAHRRYFLAGDTGFNESFASFVAAEGTRRFLTESPPQGEKTPAPAAALTHHQARQAEQARFRELVLRTRARLVNLYGSDLPDAAKRERKAALFANLRRDYQNVRESFKILNYDNWFAQPLNNAHLVGFAQYHLRVQAFRALFKQTGGSFSEFYAAVEALGELPPEERAARLKHLEQTEQ